MYHGIILRNYITELYYAILSQPRTLAYVRNCTAPEALDWCIRVLSLQRTLLATDLHGDSPGHSGTPCNIPGPLGAPQDAPGPSRHPQGSPVDPSGPQGKDHLGPLYHVFFVNRGHSRGRPDHGGSFWDRCFWLGPMTKSCIYIGKYTHMYIYIYIYI